MAYDNMACQHCTKIITSRTLSTYLRRSCCLHEHLHEKNDFAKVSKNLDKFENNFVKVLKQLRENMCV